MERTSAVLEAVGFAAECLGRGSWDNHVKTILAKLASAADVSRVYVFENHLTPAGELLTSQRCEWVAEGITPQLDNQDLQNIDIEAMGFARWKQLMQRHEPVYGVLKEFPDVEREFLEAQDIRSVAVVPIIVGKDWWGMLGFDDCLHERHWSRTELEALSAAANIFGAAVQHRRMAALERRLIRLANFDDLSGLPNRRAMREVMEREHARATRMGHPYCIAIVDVDRFKLINDIYGHRTGDDVLTRIAENLRDQLRDGDWIGRWGGEEFLCFLYETDNDQARLVMDRLCRNIASTPVALGEIGIDVTASVGVAQYAGPDDSLESVVMRADVAMYRAKRDGRNRVHVAENDRRHAYSQAGQIQTALNDARVVAAYQPIVDLKTREIIAEESLARIECMDGTLLSAQNFIDEASQLQLLHKVDSILMKQSMERCASRILNGTVYRQFGNLSADLLRHPELVQDLLDFAMSQCLRCSGLLGEEKPFVIEITEREFMGDVRKVQNILAPFLDFGMKLAIDDFGSGYSSFRYLALLPVTYLKIDGELVTLAKTETRARSIVRSIQHTAETLGLTTVAECIEDEKTADMVEALGVDWAQGLYFGAPEVPAVLEPARTMTH
ncbi:MAG: EAL domain-containing protein [Pseudomonadota bacterium]|nr:EAL domain-containing protein [Pseudomonadota bacterium]